MQTIEFHGIECVEIANDHLSMLATKSVGPRILSLKPIRGESLFAVLPRATLEYPGRPPFHFYGGHRLWHAPEDPRITYVPDDSPVELETMSDGIRLTQLAEPQTMLEKTLQVRLSHDRASAEIKHTLTNRGDNDRVLAPWAITQLKPGGVAILPQCKNGDEANPTLPNRTITLWSYTDINSDHITWGNEFVLVEAKMKQGKLKVGFPNPDGWMAYWLGGLLFVKRAGFTREAGYFDRGSSSECYCDPRFLELESLGPITRLPPGGSVEHLEVWDLHEGVEWSDDLLHILSIIRGE
jgi:hypothetical protein